MFENLFKKNSDCCSYSRDRRPPIFKGCKSYESVANMKHVFSFLSGLSERRTEKSSKISKIFALKIGNISKFPAFSDFGSTTCIYKTSNGGSR